MRERIGFLTERQAQILRFASMGYTQAEISRALGISQPRVSAALRTGREKLQKAEETLEFCRELRYIGEVRRSGFRGEIPLRERR
jgi:transcriptional regulator